MKIKKYTDFINEEFNDTPESYVEVALKQIKRKIDKMFEFQEGDDEEDENRPEEKGIKQAKKDSKDKNGINFKDLGVKLDSSEISKYSKMYDSLTVKFTDDDYTYNLFIAIDIKEAIPEDNTKDFSWKDIKKCYVKFKKYSLNNLSEVLGQLNKNINIADIDENFLIDLKLEIDEDFGDDEEFKIETE